MMFGLPIHHALVIQYSRYHLLFWCYKLTCQPNWMIHYYNKIYWVLLSIGNYIETAAWLKGCSCWSKWRRKGKFHIISWVHLSIYIFIFQCFNPQYMFSNSQGHISCCELTKNLCTDMWIEA